VIESLVPTSVEGPPGLGNTDHPMRVMTRRVAGLEPGEWDSEASRAVTALFDGLAPEWHTRASPERTRVVLDAIERGLEPLVSSRRLCLEVGSGIGTYSTQLDGRFDVIISAELSWEMLSRAPDTTFRVQADGGRLPICDHAASAIVLINAFLFPTEVNRVLAPDGVLLWVNSSGEQTPIHLTTAEIEASLPFPVDGVESRAGAGTWCALRRA
jgi:SAM-dependent methyltransferase